MARTAETLAQRDGFFVGGLLVELEKQYPEDEHILSMKGSLHERLGNKNLARDAWQQALTLNPFNLAVLEALQRLGK